MEFRRVLLLSCCEVFFDFGHGAHPDDEDQSDRMRAEVEEEEDGEEDEQDRLDEQHQNQISGDLAEVDRRLVAGDEQQALPAVVLALGQERPAEPDEPAQDEPEPEETRQGRRETLAVGPERELEQEEEQQGEEEERVQRLLGASLAEEILPQHDPGAARVGHPPFSACSTWIVLWKDL